jgi:hypothetical protein
MAEVYPGNKMFGNNDYQEWTDIEQGNTGNCYIMAALGVISEYTEIMNKVFLIDQENEAGIYAFRFFIRGKPWVVTIDDEMTFNAPFFAPTLHFA